MTTDKRDLVDKTTQENRDKNDELTVERREKADKVLEDNRSRNDELTADRREKKDESQDAALVLCLMIVAGMIAVAFFI